MSFKLCSPSSLPWAASLGLLPSHHKVTVIALAQARVLCWLSPVFAVKVNHKHNQVNSRPVHIGRQREGVGQVAEKQDITGLDTQTQLTVKGQDDTLSFIGKEAASEGAQQDGASSAQTTLNCQKGLSVTTVLRGLKPCWLRGRPGSGEGCWMEVVRG